MEVTTIAQFMADEFNKLNIGGKKIKFLKVSVLSFKKIKKVDGKTIEQTRFYAVEKLFKVRILSTYLLSNVQGDFKRFNANGGTITTFHSTLEAFCHFTYHFSKGYIIVTDLQGVDEGDQFVLTDPGSFVFFVHIQLFIAKTIPDMEAQILQNLEWSYFLKTTLAIPFVES